MTVQDLLLVAGSGFHLDEDTSASTITIWSSVDAGDTGVAGSQGDTGVAGTIGVDGDTGVAGDTGAGTTGDTGADSTVAGDTGIIGNTGITGDTGADSTVAGDTGVAGAQGDTGADSTVAGDTGITGNTGTTGDTGADSTVAGDTGTAGTTGDTGTSGDTGVTGTSGSLTGTLDSNLALNEYNIELSIPTAVDETSSGIIYKDATVDTNAKGIGAPLFMAADKHFDTATGSIITAPCVALALEAGTGTKDVLLLGGLQQDDWSWVTGPGTKSLIYISGSLGTLTQTIPTLTDQMIQPIGYAITGSYIWFNPSLMFATVI